MMKRKIIEKVSKKEKNYLACLLLAGVASLNVGFTTQENVAAPAETAIIEEVDILPTSFALGEGDGEVVEIEDFAKYVSDNGTGSDVSTVEVTADPVAPVVEDEVPVDVNSDYVSNVVEPAPVPENNVYVSDEGFEYEAVMSMNASAYLPSDGGGSGITAMGIRATYGVAAVDPRIIPLGTRLYIPGYGEAIAADTGGAIRGYSIDLCMESYSEAMNFGRRTVTVYVLK